MSDLVISVLVLIALLVGLAGTIIPVLPGIFVMWGAVVVYGIAVGFDAVAVAVVVIVTVLVAISIGLGFALPKQAADAAGASTKAQWAAVGGAIIGFFLIPVVGVIVGAVLGIALAEYLDKDDWGIAWQSTKGVLKGMGLAAVAEFTIGAVILVIWLAWAALTVL